MMCTRSDKDSTFGLGLHTSRDGFLEELNNELDEMIKCVAYRGNKEGNIRSSVRDIHNFMKANYSVMMDTVGNRGIYPLIVASDNDPELEGIGSTFTLYKRDGTAKRICAVSHNYEFFKGLSHMPLGLFTIISAYFQAGKCTTWVPLFQTYKTKVNDALFALSDAGENDFPAALKEHAEEMLVLVRDFIDERIAAKEVDKETFVEFGKKIYPRVHAGLVQAAQLQVEANLPALLEFKRDLGDDWKNVYVVIPTVWPVSGINPRQQILEQIMDKNCIDTHIILTENASSVEAAKACVGRVVADRVLAQLFFGVVEDEKKPLNFALSSKRDLLADACAASIAKFYEEHPDFVHNDI